MKRARTVSADRPDIPDVPVHDLPSIRQFFGPPRRTVPPFRLDGEQHGTECLAELYSLVRSYEADFPRGWHIITGKLWSEHLIPFPQVDCTGYNLIAEEGRASSLGEIRDFTKLKMLRWYDSTANCDDIMRDHGQMYCDASSPRCPLACDHCKLKFAQSLTDDDWEFEFQLLQEEQWKVYEEGVLHHLSEPRPQFYYPNEASPHDFDAPKLDLFTLEMIKLLTYNLIAKTDANLQRRCAQFQLDAPPPVQSSDIATVVCEYLGGRTPHEIPAWRGASYEEVWAARVQRGSPLETTEEVLPAIVVNRWTHLLFKKIGAGFWRLPSWAKNTQTCVWPCDCTTCAP
jgi:hypothetical protein